jgi:hypothetical protein
MLAFEFINAIDAVWYVGSKQFGFGATFHALYYGVPHANPNLAGVVAHE